MKNLQHFEEYAAWLRMVYKKDPLLLLSRRTFRYNFGIPKDNGLLVFSCPLNELEKMIVELGFVPKPGVAVSQLKENETPWTREPVTFTHKKYVGTDKLTILQVEGLEQPKFGEIIATGVNDAKREFSFRGMYGGIGSTVGKMRIQSQLLLHPYGGRSVKRFSDEQYAAMKEIYARNAAEKIEGRTVEELMRPVNFTLFYRQFADEFLDIIKYISQQDCQAVYQSFKASRLIAGHNVPLKF